MGTRFRHTEMVAGSQDFKPARPQPRLVALAARLNRFLLSRRTRVEIDAEDLACLRALPPGSLIAPNHAHHADPRVLCELARRAGRHVVYMATREAFDMWGGWAGWLLQRLGVFSVSRGGDNGEARGFARSVLVAGTHDLVMFPEGEVYLLNDLVMPLKPGVARLALEAADDLARQGRSRPVLIVPIVIKYRFAEDVSAALERAAARLETRLLGQRRTGPLYPRIVALGTEVLGRAESAYAVTPAPGEGLHERVRRLRRTLLERLERKHFGEVRAGFDFDRARKLVTHIQAVLTAGGAAPRDRGPQAAPFRDALIAGLVAAHLCARSVSFPEDYLREAPTPERMAETLVKLEREVVGHEIRSPLGRRRAAGFARPAVPGIQLPGSTASRGAAALLLRSPSGGQHRPAPRFRRLRALLPSRTGGRADPRGAVPGR